GQWLNVQTPGLYIVTATNNLGCTDIDSVYVSERTVIPPTITADGPTTFCAGGGVDLYATPGYQNYQWNNVYPSNGESVTAHYGGTVSVFTTDSNGCNSSSNEITITVSYGPQQPTVTPLGCELISSAVSGNQWFVNGTALGDTSQIITPSVSGLFTVTVFDSLGCSSSSSQVPFQVQNLPVITTNGPVEFCEGGSVLLTVLPGSDFIWSTGDTLQHLLVTTSGTYTVTVTSGNCIQQASPVTVTVDSCGATGISEVGAKANVHLFPNPAQDIVTITSPENFSDVIVTDMTGRKVIQIQPVSNNTTFNVGELPAGVYFVSGKSGGEATFSKKFVKH
ncbi:MAG: T9SS type A sorting domain-containing protein, partial [Candidatus Pacebacteria bacterium]|nr:T9SS type A sorting domain-containing protein [Candidatus Paceibacterota bacterium]